MMSKKKLEKEIERLYYKNGDGVQINIMNIGKVFSDCTEAYNRGEDLETAVLAAIAKYREN